MTIEEGDGTMQRRLDMGLCPNCQTAMDPGPATVCRGCGLQINDVVTCDFEDHQLSSTMARQGDINE